MPRGLDLAAVAAVGAAAGPQRAADGGLPAGDADAAGGGGALARGVNHRRRRQGDAAGIAAVENDLAVMGLDRMGLDHAAGVDDVAHGAIDGAGGNLHGAAVGGYAAAVGNQRRRRRVGDLIAPQPVAGGVQGETGGAAQGDPAQLGGDAALVVDPRRRQHHLAAVGGGDTALIDDVALARHR